MPIISNITYANHIKYNLCRSYQRSEERRVGKEC